MLAALQAGTGWVLLPPLAQIKELFACSSLEILRAVAWICVCARISSSHSGFGNCGCAVRLSLVRAGACGL